MIVAAIQKHQVNLEAWRMIVGAKAMEKATGVIGDKVVGMAQRACCVLGFAVAANAGCRGI